MKPELKLCGLLADGDDVDTEKARYPGPEHRDGACRCEEAGTGAFRRAWDSGNRCSRDPLEAAMIISNSSTCSEGPVSGGILGSLRGYDGEFFGTVYWSDRRTKRWGWPGRLRVAALGG